PDDLAEALASHAGKSVALGLRQNRPEAIEEALRIIADEKSDKTQQLEYIQILGEVKRPACVTVLLKVMSESTDDGLRGAALSALQKYDDPTVAPAVLNAYGNFTDDVRSVAHTRLASRPAWTLELLQAIEAGKIDPNSVPLEIVQKIELH